MSQRNPLNDRYQNADDRKGTTRKSAASAKPATKAASSVRIEGKVEEPKGLFARASAQANKTQAMKNSRAKQNDKARVERRKEQAIRAKYYTPDTPEYKKWKRVWWGMLGGALVTTALSFWMSSQEQFLHYSYILIGLSYFLLIMAIVFDFGYLRKLRNEYQDRMVAEEKSKKNSAKRKEQAAEERRLAKEAEAAAEAGEEEEKRGLFRGLFTKKRASEAVATAKEAQVRAAAEEAEAVEAK